MQGAGPLTTKWGRMLTRLILDRVDVFIVRDSGTLKLLQQLNSTTRLVLGHDGIFLGDFTTATLNSHEEGYVERLMSTSGNHSVIGFNVRQWFHFASSILPYQYAKRKYEARSEQMMAELVRASTLFLESLRQQLDARILLISMYEPNIEPWEDDLPYLEQIKANFAADDNVVVVDKPLGIHAFCRLISELDLMVGTRLHSTLAAMRFGVPAVNLSYTLKGKDIYTDMGLADHVLILEDFISQPETAVKLVRQILQDGIAKERVNEVVNRAIQHNRKILDQLLEQET